MLFYFITLPPVGAIQASDKIVVRSRLIGTDGTIQWYSPLTDFINGGNHGYIILSQSHDRTLGKLGYVYLLF